MHFKVYLFIFGCAASSLPHRLCFSCGEGVLFSLVVVCRLLIVVASLVAEHVL